MRIIANIHIHYHIYYVIIIKHIEQYFRNIDIFVHYAQNTRLLLLILNKKKQISETVDLVIDFSYIIDGVTSVARNTSDIYDIIKNGSIHIME